MTGSKSAQWTRFAYLVIAASIVATVVWGFWSSYWLPLIGGGVEHFWFIHVHAFVFLAFVLVLLVQSALVAGRMVNVHRALGSAGAVCGAAVFTIGFFVSIAAPVARVAEGQISSEAARLVALYNLTDMAIYGAFFLWALLFRHALAMHRRAMLCASVALTGAAVGRVLPSDSLGYLLVWLAPLIAAIAVDVVSERRVHPMLVVGAIAFLFMFFKVSLYAGSAPASAIGGAIIGPLLRVDL